MAERHNQREDMLASMTLRRSYLKKLIFRKAVMKKRRHLLPKMSLQGESRRAGAKLRSGNREFSVTFSLGKNKADRLVLLQTGWKDVVSKLGLKEGDKVTISLANRANSTYSIDFTETVSVPVERPQAEEAKVYQGGDAHATVKPGNMKFDLNKPPQAEEAKVYQGGDVHATVKPGNMKFDLNKPPQAEEAKVYQGGDAHATVKPVNMKFDLNKRPVESDEEEINDDEE